MKTDRQLQQDVLAELSWDPSIDAAKIGVEVDEGVVTLAGEVGSYGEKRGVESAAQRVSGVKALVIAIDVVLPGASRRSDPDIAVAAKNALQSMTYVPKDSVQVMIENGWVTLSGNVEWDFQRKAAHVGVLHLVGVKGVIDEVVIKPKATQVLVKSDIEVALKRNAESDAENISVEVDGTEVTLSGNVRSWSERDLANRAAWGTPGVRNVVDEITVTG